MTDPKPDRFDLNRWPGRDEAVTLSDGRRLQVRHYGDEAGLPLLMLHGTPGSRIMFAGTHAPAEQRHVHIIALDRWSYGGSTAPPKPSLAHFATDAAELMARLGHQTFSVAGVSGGGPYTAAIAAHLPDRVQSAAMISPVGLVREATAAGEVDAFHHFCFHVLPRAPRVIDIVFAGYARAVRASAGLACGLTTFRAPAADKAIMADCATSERLLAAFHEGLRTSSKGPAIDLKVFQELNSLDLARATMPTRVWIGTADRNVPVGAARRLAHRLPNATLSELPGAGHLWVAHNYAEVLDWVAGAAHRSKSAVQQLTDR
jgi:pimeloyl-ACP methyl ester carboxylesterase